MLEMNLLFKKMVNEVTERYLEQVNMPTADDLASISSLIVNVDAKVDDLEALLEESKGSSGVSQVEFTNELNNVKKDIKGLDEKLNQVIALLEAQAEKTTCCKRHNLAHSTQKAQTTSSKSNNRKSFTN